MRCLSVKKPENLFAFSSIHVTPLSSIRFYLRCHIAVCVVSATIYHPAITPTTMGSYLCLPSNYVHRQDTQALEIHIAATELKKTTLATTHNIVQASERRCSLRRNQTRTEREHMPP